MLSIAGNCSGINCRHLHHEVTKDY